MLGTCSWNLCSPWGRFGGNGQCGGDSTGAGNSINFSHGPTRTNIKKKGNKPFIGCLDYKYVGKDLPKQGKPFLSVCHLPGSSLLDFEFSVQIQGEIFDFSRSNR